MGTKRRYKFEELCQIIDKKVAAIVVSQTDDHGLLTGLTDDDHTLYLRKDGGRNMDADASFQLGRDPTAALEPVPLRMLQDYLEPGEAVGGNCVPNSDLGLGVDTATPPWFTQTTGNTITNEDSAGESVPGPQRIMKCVTSGSGADVYSYVRMTIADHWTLEMARDNALPVSVGLYCYQATTADTLKIQAVSDTGGTLGSATTTTKDSVALLKIETVTLDPADTYLDLKWASGSNSDTFYVWGFMCNVGGFLRPYATNPSYFVRNPVVNIINTATPPSSPTDFDNSANVHPLAWRCSGAVDADASSGSADCMLRADYETAASNYFAKTYSAGTTFQRNYASWNIGDTGHFDYWDSTGNGNRLRVHQAGYWRFSF